MTWVAVAIGGAAIVGGGASIYGANKQSQAANNAAGSQMQMFGQTQQNLYPWLTSGQSSLNALDTGLGISKASTPDWQAYLAQNPDVAASQYYANNPMQHYNDWGKSEGRKLPMTAGINAQTPGFGSLTKPFTLADFNASPAYNFNLQEGEKAINKGANARGNYYAPQTLQDLGKYSQGVASNEFNNAYNQYHGQQQQAYQMLANLSGQGANAGAGIGGFGAQAVNQAGQYGTSGAAAQAGGIMGAANAFGGAGLGLAGYNQYLQGLQSPTYGGGSAGAGAGGYGGVPLDQLANYYGYGGGGGSVPIGI